MAKEKNNKLKELTQELQEASKAYYTENRELMSNKEYDQKYDELAFQKVQHIR